jgi:UDP-N-acetylglucosamine 4-epimerase
MHSSFLAMRSDLAACRTLVEGERRRWIITGVAGFIGSNILECLLDAGQVVVGLDDFATGSWQNLADVRATVGAEAWSRFRFVEGDLRDAGACREACRDGGILLHQAALGSVPRSIKDPLTSHQVNVTGMLQLVLSARDAGVTRIVYASSSSVYGDHPALPKVEDVVGRQLSPYAVTKYADELYANVCAEHYLLTIAGLRYFNVFGPRQSPAGAYAAVIPRWIEALSNGIAGVIHGDGATSRDFCYVANVVQANLRAALAPLPQASHTVFNIACGRATTLVTLYELLRAAVAANAGRDAPRAVHEDFRPGDIRHSLADTTRAATLLGYRPTHQIEDGIPLTVDWFLRVRESSEAGAR